MSDLQEVKKRIYDEGKIEEILDKLDCWDIKPEQRGNLYTAGLPDGDNSRSVQIKNNESLNVHIRSKGIKGDIFSLVSYVIYNATTEIEQKECLHKSKFWICQQFNYYEYIDEFYKVTCDHNPVQVNYNKWLKEIQKKRPKEEYDITPNKVYDESILKDFGLIPYKKWIDEGISYHTQSTFSVGIDVKSERITFPIHNSIGQIIGVKGRYCGLNKEIEDKYKYLYLYPCNKSIEFFNLHRALPYILEKKEVIVVEGGKTCMLLDQWNYKNSISIEGDSLSPTQISLLKNLGIDIKHIYAWDKGKDIKFIRQQALQVTGRLKYGLYDKDNLLEDKMSPTDLGLEIWERLYTQYKYKII